MKIGDRVEKVTGDYTFKGTVVAVFNKLNDGPLRVVVENEQGILHIFNPNQLNQVSLAQNLTQNLDQSLTQNLTQRLSE